jgi:hypothetical protein
MRYFGAVMFVGVSSEKALFHMKIKFILLKNPMKIKFSLLGKSYSYINHI